MTKHKLEELIISEEEYMVKREEIADILRMLRRIEKKLNISDINSEAFEHIRAIRWELYNLEKLLNANDLLL